ncbi:MAG: hypothetical protein K0U93_30990 [Gammaproteobacteria bacterium]|nr:hypothetical protein [Gammaproteobacteria bacterium]
MFLERFLPIFRSRPAVLIIAVGALLGFLIGSFSVFVLGVLIAAGYAAMKASSSQTHWIESVSRYAGVKDVRRVEDLRALASTLSAAGRTPGAEQLGIQAHEQFDNVGKKYAAFRELLDQKFNVSEVTHGRYAKSADQVFLATLDNLDKVSSMLKGIGAIDIDQLRAQVRALKRQDALSDAQGRELATLEERLNIRETELESVRDLLSDNEAALTQMTLASAEMAKLETESGRAALDSHDAMKQLEALATRLDRYSVDRK